MTSALEDRSLYLENKNDMTKVYFDNKIHFFFHHFRDLIGIYAESIFHSVNLLYQDMLSPILSNLP